MAKTRKSWREKLADDKGLPKVEKILFAKPQDIEPLLHKVPRGKVVIIKQVREKLAKKFHTDATCTKAINSSIKLVAQEAEEDLKKEKRQVTPYWRVIKADGSLNEKFPGGVTAQAVHLREEGHIIEPGKGKKSPKVKDFEKALQEL